MTFGHDAPKSSAALALGCLHDEAPVVLQNISMSPNYWACCLYTQQRAVLDVHHSMKAEATSSSYAVILLVPSLHCASRGSLRVKTTTVV